jgi:hypothetical protein
MDVKHPDVVPFLHYMVSQTVRKEGARSIPLREERVLLTALEETREGVPLVAGSIRETLVFRYVKGMNARCAPETAFGSLR